MESDLQVMKDTSKIFYINAVLRSATLTDERAVTKGWQSLVYLGVVLHIHSSEGSIHLCLSMYECFKV